MKTKNSVLKNAQKLGRDQQKTIIGGGSAARRCCEWNEAGACTLWACDRCQCP